MAYDADAGCKNLDLIGVLFDIKYMLDEYYIMIKTCLYHRIMGMFEYLHEYVYVLITINTIVLLFTPCH